MKVKLILFVMVLTSLTLTFEIWSRRSNSESKLSRDVTSTAAVKILPRVPSTSAQSSVENKIAPSKEPKNETRIHESKDYDNVDFQKIKDQERSNSLIKIAKKFDIFKAKEISRSVQSDGTTLIEGEMQDGSTLKAKLSPTGSLVADQINLSDGRQMSRVLFPDGSFRELYYRQDNSNAFSVTFAPSGAIVKIIEKSNDKANIRSY